MRPGVLQAKKTEFEGFLEKLGEDIVAQSFTDQRDKANLEARKWRRAGNKSRPVTSNQGQEWEVLIQKSAPVVNAGMGWKFQG